MTAAPPETGPSARYRELMERLRDLERDLAEVRSALRGRVGGERPAERFEVLPTRVGGEAVALPLERVREVVPIARLTALPEAPAWIPGLLNLRGSSIPVLDLESRMRRRPREPELSELIVIVSSGGRRVGLVVAEVGSPRWKEPAEIDPDVGHLPLGPYLLGTIPDGDAGHLLLFDLDTLIDLSDLPEAT